MTEQLPDDEIIAQVLGGNRELFALLYDRYHRYVAAVICKFVPSGEVEPLVIDTFFEAFKTLKSFSGKSGFRHWLATVASRRCYAWLRDTKKRSELPLSQFPFDAGELLSSLEQAAATDAFDEEQHRAAARQLLQWAMAALSPEDRAVLVLVYLEGYSSEETAEMLGWTITNVRVRTYRAKNALRKILETA